MPSTALPSLSSILSSIHGLPASAVVPICTDIPVMHDPDLGSWSVDASPGENDGWYVEISIQQCGDKRHVANVRIDGGLDEAGHAIDLIRDRLNGITPDQVTYG